MPLRCCFFIKKDSGQNSTTSSKPFYVCVDTVTDVSNIILPLELSVPPVFITHGTHGCLVTYGKLIENA